jgi:hypothetical protein
MPFIKYLNINSLTWKKSVKRDMTDWNIVKELAIDRGLTIDMPQA